MGPVAPLIVFHMILLPTQQAATYIKARTKPHERNDLPSFEPARTIEHIERIRYAGARDVSRALERAHDARVLDSQPLDGLRKDPLICLMKHKVFDIAQLKMGALDKLCNHVADRCDAELEHLAPVHGEHALARSTIRMLDAKG